MSEGDIFDYALDKVYQKFGERAFIPICDVARWIGEDVRTLRNNKEFGVRKIGGRYFISAIKLAEWLI